MAMNALIGSGEKVARTGYLAIFFRFSIFFIALPASADINLLYGDIDGFGFTSVEELLDEFGAPADINGNGTLDPGDVLPSGGGGQSPGVSPGIGLAEGWDDYFNNRSGADPEITDAGLFLDEVVTIDFNFTIPEGHVIKRAKFILVAADLSRNDTASHVVLVDGQPTGQTLEPRVQDGSITLSNIVIDKTLQDTLVDGQVRISLVFDSAPDDVAIDYAQLHIKTGPEVLSLPFLPLLLE